MTLGSLKPHELMIAYLSLVVAVRTIVRSEPTFSMLERFRWPLLFLLFCIACSTIYAHFFAHNEFLLAELRIFVAWLILPSIVLAVRNESDYRLLFRGMILFGIAMSIIVITQSVFNIRILTEARVEALDNATNLDVTRSLAGGATYFMVFGLYYFLNHIALRRGPFMLYVIGSLVLTGGLAVTFGRGVWVATVVGLIVTTFINRGLRGVAVSGLIGVLVISGMLGVGGLFKPRLVEAIVERAVGVGQEYQSGGSFGWRARENRAALAALEAHPLTGVGLGGEYKYTISAVGSFKNETRYIHNAYIAHAVKMGTHAALFPLWMILAFFVTGLGALRAGNENNRPLQAALIGAFLVPVITSYTQPEWFDSSGIIAFSFFIGGLILSAQGRFREISVVKA